MCVFTFRCFSCGFTSRFPPCLCARVISRVCARVDMVVRQPVEGLSGLQGRRLPVVARSEVAKHHTRGDCWVVINNAVYNLSEWAPRHPGGEHMIALRAGTDISDQFLAFHPKGVRETYTKSVLAKCLVGQAEHLDLSPVQVDYRKLDSEFEMLGMYKWDPRFYLQNLPIIIAFFVASLWLAVNGGSFFTRAVLGGLCMVRTPSPLSPPQHILSMVVVLCAVCAFV